MAFVWLQMPFTSLCTTQPRASSHKGRVSRTLMSCADLESFPTSAGRGPRGEGQNKMQNRTFSGDNLTCREPGQAPQLWVCRMDLAMRTNSPDFE